VTAAEQAALGALASEFAHGKTLAELGDGAEDRLREAFRLLGTQGVAACQAHGEVVSLCAMACNTFDAAIDPAAETHSESEWILGYLAGVASSMARASHVVGHIANAGKMREVGG
jgi:hypothetical protein